MSEDPKQRLADIEAELVALRAENARLRGETPAVETPAAAEPAKPPTLITCPGCGDETESPDGTADFLLRNVSMCSKCKTRIVYGEIGTRVVFEPAFITNATGTYKVLMVRVQDGPLPHADKFQFVIDAEYAALIGPTLIRSVSQ